MSKDDCNLCPQFLKLHYKMIAVLILLASGFITNGVGLYKEWKIYDLLTTVQVDMGALHQKVDDHIVKQVDKGVANVLEHDRGEGVPTRLAEGVGGDRRMQQWPIKIPRPTTN